MARLARWAWGALTAVPVLLAVDQGLVGVRPIAVPAQGEQRAGARAQEPERAWVLVARRRVHPPRAGDLVRTPHPMDPTRILWRVVLFDQAGGPGDNADAETSPRGRLLSPRGTLCIVGRQVLEANEAFAQAAPDPLDLAPPAARALVEEGEDSMRFGVIPDQMITGTALAVLWPPTLAGPVRPAALPTGVVSPSPEPTGV